MSEKYKPKLEDFENLKKLLNDHNASMMDHGRGIKVFSSITTKNPLRGLDQSRFSPSNKDGGEENKE